MNGTLQKFLGKRELAAALLLLLLLLSACLESSEMPPSKEEPVESPEVSLCKEIISAYKEVRDLPYKWGGSEIKDGGLDCSGLVHWISKRIGRPVPRTTSYKYYITTKGNDVHWSDAECGYWVWWTFSPDRPYGHIGIHLEQPEFIQSGSNTGPTISIHREGEFWNRIHEASKKVYN